MITLASLEFEDAIADGEGLVEAAYAGWYDLLCVDERVAYRLRRYRDTPGEAAFLTYRRAPPWSEIGPSDGDRRFEHVPVEDPDFVAAVRHAAAEFRLHMVTVLLPSGRYEPVSIGA
jgi:hypothetical protein